MDHKKHSTGVYFDLSKTFDTDDHSILIDRLANTSFSRYALDWFANYVLART